MIKRDFAQGWPIPVAWSLQTWHDDTREIQTLQRFGRRLCWVNCYRTLLAFDTGPCRSRETLLL